MNLKKHKQSIVVGLILLVLVFLFLWREKLTLKAPINDQKVTNFFITAFTAVGTLATTLYTIRQYRLSTLSQRTAIKPEIYPLTGMFKMQDAEEPLEIEGIEAGLYLTHPYPIKDNKKLYIKNLGVGLAKNISATWIFDKKEVESLIQGVYYITPDDKPKVIPFLSSTDSADISSPHAYLSCCGPRLFTHLEHKYFSNTAELDLHMPQGHLQAQLLEWKDETFGKKRPSLTLRIKYSDIQDHEYIRDFNTEVTGVLNFVTLTFYNP
jgi:hypothetical protein